MPNFLEIAPAPCPSGTLVTARSYLVDRMVPDVEIVQLPETELAGGQFLSELGTFSFDPPAIKRSSRQRMFIVNRRGAGPGPLSPDRVLIDLRMKHPENWAHILNNHLPIVFHLLHAHGVPAAEALLLLPEGTPDHVLSAAALFNLDTRLTNAAVSGRGIRFAVDPWTTIRAARAGWAQLPVAEAGLAGAGLSPGQTSGFGGKAFLSRKHTRTLENEAEVEAWLADRGFRKYYAEDLSIPDQFKLFHDHDDIVAIHGAALAPLLYTRPEGRPRRLVELLPCGHMTNVYRAMAAQVGCGWVGVRGRIKPEHIAPAYDLATPFVKYSLQSFTVDLAALDRAFDLRRDIHHA